MGREKLRIGGLGKGEVVSKDGFKVRFCLEER